MKERFTAYGVISAIGYIVRNLFLPNPFECFEGKALWINLIAEPIIHLIAFLITGLFYEEKSLPWWGSLLYFLFYSAIVLALWLLSLVNFVWWSIVIAVIVIAAIAVGIFILCSLQEDYD